MNKECKNKKIRNTETYLGVAECICKRNSPVTRRCDIKTKAKKSSGSLLFCNLPQ